MKGKDLKDYNLVKGCVIKALKFDSFWDTESKGVKVELVYSGTVELVAKGPLYGGGYHTGYVFNMNGVQVVLCELHSWGSSTECRYGDVFSECGFRLL